MPRPNVLIIKADQHNARCLGVNGHRQVRTPHLDQFAGEGVHFTRAFVQSPICSPSRMSYLTGQYAYNHGVFGLSGDETVPKGLPLLFQAFKEETREALRRALFDWTLLTTRFNNVWPRAGHGGDGKVTLAELKRLLDQDRVNYL
jgi:hypothetical protein